ncbi:type II toxin-antitoxin system RelE/ParE family toxin [Rhizobium herbae]|uniref:Phage-related protein n=1 Tax=Rhizobium herbae TaxID=508661 RepID=A0ABS4EJV1_9HYPH|nr:type II toxin-antitoxin system RelE/ParE family toxin [Rhizobium herbae]MBP1858221.1 phage-related protein [Rhizobium herbae]
MTSDDAVDIKEVVFLSQRVEDDYLSQPGDVVEAFDARVTAVQNLQRLPAKHHRALSGNLNGIEELRVSHDSNTYRTYYLANYEEAVILIEAGMKKSKKDGEIPAEQVARLVERKRQADQFYAENRILLRTRYEMRQQRRALS